MELVYWYKNFLSSKIKKTEKTFDKNKLLIDNIVIKNIHEKSLVKYEVRRRN